MTFDTKQLPVIGQSSLSRQLHVGGGCGCCGWFLVDALERTRSLCLWMMVFVCHGAVTYFYRVSVKYFVEFTGCWKILVNETEKLSTCVGPDVFAVWRVVTGNIAVSLVSVRRGILGHFAVLIRKVRGEISAVKDFLVWWNCFLKSWGVAGEFW